MIFMEADIQRHIADAWGEPACSFWKNRKIRAPGGGPWRNSWTRSLLLCTGERAALSRHRRRWPASRLPVPAPPGARATTGRLAGTDPSDLAAQHCVLVPQDQKLGVLGHLPPGQRR